MKSSFIIILSLFNLIGCVDQSTQSHISHASNFDEVKSNFMDSCEHSENRVSSKNFCSCMWDQTKVVYSPDEIKNGLQNASAIKMQINRFLIVKNCILNADLIKD